MNMLKLITIDLGNFKISRTATLMKFQKLKSTGGEDGEIRVDHVQVKFIIHSLSLRVVVKKLAIECSSLTSTCSFFDILR